MKKRLITQSEAGERLDQFLANSLTAYSRNYLVSLIKDGHIVVNGKSERASYRLKIGDIIDADLVEKEGIKLEAEDIPLDIIYEDNDVIVVNKQPGLVVHPAAGSKSGTLINALLAHFPKIREVTYEDSEISKIRPGLVQRLDRGTSGVMIVAKNARAMHSLARQIQNRTAKKSYIALCYGWPKNDSGKLVNYLGRHPKERKQYTEVGEDKGRIAISRYKVLEYFENKEKKKLSLVRFDIETGRTHQIRVQSKLAGFPVIGDAVYTSRDSEEISKKLGASRQMLHSKSLTISLPGKPKSRTFIAPEPDDFKKILARLNKIS